MSDRIRMTLALRQRPPEGAPVVHAAETRAAHARVRAWRRALLQPDVDREVLRVQIRAARLGERCPAEWRLRRGER